MQKRGTLRPAPKTNEARGGKKAHAKQPRRKKRKSGVRSPTRPKAAAPKKRAETRPTRGPRTAGNVKATPRKKGGNSRTLSAWLQGWEHGTEIGALVAVRESTGSDLDDSVNAFRVGGTQRAKRRGRGATGGGALRKGGLRIPPATWRALAAVGHVQRGRIMTKLLEGPATYQALQKVTKLKAGPLYHHVNQLRLAGLMLPKERDLYELTKGGRNLILAVIAVGGLIRDKRRRPVPVES
jgi:hypothetical protein